MCSKKTGDDESTYDYTFEGLMDEYASGESAVYFTYDADNRRIWAKRNGTEEKYVLNDQDVIADYDGEDTLVATYNTPTLDSNVTKKVGENVYFYVRDGLGSIRNILDSKETAQNAYDYLAFGSMYGSPTENVANRYRFTAREWEIIPALHYYRARMYDQLIGRFISKDTEFNTNLYFYVLNNPVVKVDPQGTEVIDTFWATGIAKGSLNMPHTVVFFRADKTKNKGLDLSKNEGVDFAPKKVKFKMTVEDLYKQCSARVGGCPGTTKASESKMAAPLDLKHIPVFFPLFLQRDDLNRKMELGRAKDKLCCNPEEVTGADVEDCIKHYAINFATRNFVMENYNCFTMALTSAKYCCVHEGHLALSLLWHAPQLIWLYKEAAWIIMKNELLRMLKTGDIGIPPWIYQL